MICIHRLAPSVISSLLIGYPEKILSGRRTNLSEQAGEGQILVS